MGMGHEAIDAAAEGGFTHMYQSPMGMGYVPLSIRFSVELCGYQSPMGMGYIATLKLISGAGGTFVSISYGYGMPAQTPAKPPAQTPAWRPRRPE